VSDARFDLLEPAGVAPEVVLALRRLVDEASDAELARINALSFAEQHDIPAHRVVEGFLHASRVGLFDMHWNVVCPGCGGVLDASNDLQTFAKNSYPCSLCATAYEPTLDELVEVVFGVSPSVKRLPHHEPSKLGYWDYIHLLYFSSGLALPRDDEWDALVKRLMIEDTPLEAGERTILSFTLPPEFLILFDPVSHTTHFFDVKGEPTNERQELTVTYTQSFGTHSTFELRPGPLRLTLENRSDRRLLPGVFRANDELHAIMARRRSFLTAKHVLSNQAFRDLYKADTLSVDQRFKIASLTVLFTDLRGSTELYERVGDLMAYDLVRHHFRALAAVVREHEGAVVKTIGDAVMATFPSPSNGLGAALAMHEAMIRLNASHDRDDLHLKVGLHEGPCLAVMLNDRLDYFGQTVNIAARVQGLAGPQSIYATGAIVEHESARDILTRSRIAPVSRRASLKGIRDEVVIYEIQPHLG
jgi:class 3 adenylate cyclase